MKPITRRNFLGGSIAAGSLLGYPRFGIGAEPAAQVSGANDAVRLAIVGLGGTETVGGVGGRGHQLIDQLRKIPRARIAALCDVDSAFIERELRPFKDRGESVTTHTDLRRVLDDKSIDAVVIATPNHWHALATVWACQAGKDVYVEKPFSHNIWEGRQMVAAARKHGRVVQVGTQNRSSTLLRQTFESLRNGQLGPIRLAHAMVYRARGGIGTVTAPTPPPATVDYDLWCGPAPQSPLLRKQLHYEWHWFWATGNGEMGNNGVHLVDLCRWALGQHRPPPRAVSIAGRFGLNDCGETANTHIALLDYQPTPLLCEVRTLAATQRTGALGNYRNNTRGIVIECEGGYFAGDATGGAYFDAEGQKIKDLPDDGQSKELEATHLSNFLESVRTRNNSGLAADAQEGHLSATCCHMANVSHRLGKQLPAEAIREATRDRADLLEAFERCREYLSKNGIDLNVTPATVGPWLTFDPANERFVKEFAAPANELSRREYREPFVVPELA